MGDDRDRILYLYVFLTDALRHKGYKIVKSDTPHEISFKVSRGERIAEFGTVTDIYERLRYGELTVPDGEARAAVARMCDAARSVCRIN